jgi:hypothetical protein
LWILTDPCPGYQSYVQAFSRRADQSASSLLEPRQLAKSGTVRKQVIRRAWLGSTPEGRHPQIRGFRAGGSLAVANSTAATQVLSPAKLLKLNNATLANRASSKSGKSGRSEPRRNHSSPAGFRPASLIDPRKRPAKDASSLVRSVLLSAARALDGDDLRPGRCLRHAEMTESTRADHQLLVAAVHLAGRPQGGTGLGSGSVHLVVRAHGQQQDRLCPFMLLLPHDSASRTNSAAVIAWH